MISKLGLTPQKFSTIDSALTIAQNKQTTELAIDNYKGVSLGQAHLATAVYKEYKALLKKLDYTDLLLLVKEQKIKIPVDVVFIDEAQDLTKLQWQVVLQFFQEAKSWIVAGDPNQSIFEWAGADVPYFLNMRTDEQRVLEKSYRCCTAVWNMAKSVYACIKEKAPIPDKGTDEEGFAIVSQTNELPDNVLYSLAKQGSLLCLALQNSYLDKYIEYCITYGIPYAIKLQGRTNYCVKPSVVKYFKKLTAILQDTNLFDKYITNNSSHPRTDSRTDRAIKEQLAKDGIPEWDFTDKEAIQRNIVALIDGKLSTNEDKAFMLRSVLSGNILIAEDYITITNVHQVKGAEADYVMLCDNIAGQYRQRAENDTSYRDYLLRVLYVGVTRARHGIYIWHRNVYCTVAPTYLFCNVGSLDTIKPIVSAYAEQYIQENLKQEGEKDGNKDNKVCVD
jgi:superfamily I DNA/RNA helicase